MLRNPIVYQKWGKNFLRSYLIFGKKFGILYIEIYKKGEFFYKFY